MSTKSNEAQSEDTEGKKNPSPHDRFVQSVLEIREVAEAFFKGSANYILFLVILTIFKR